MTHNPLAVQSGAFVGSLSAMANPEPQALKFVIHFVVDSHHSR
jgi:hypothetical protein